MSRYSFGVGRWVKLCHLEHHRCGGNLSVSFQVPKNKKLVPTKTKKALVATRSDHPTDRSNPLGRSRSDGSVRAPNDGVQGDAGVQILIKEAG